MLVLFLPWVDVDVNLEDHMASTAALEQEEQEEFDDAFWREVDAAEAAAVLEQQGQKTSSYTITVADLSPTMSPPQKRLKQETCHKDGTNVERMLRYRWKVASISVHGDGSKIEEEWIGEVGTPWPFPRCCCMPVLSI